MLKLIEGSYASFFPKEMDAMFRNRAETFSERLGWEVVVKNGYERDVFRSDVEAYRGIVCVIFSKGNGRHVPQQSGDLFRAARLGGRCQKRVRARRFPI